MKWCLGILIILYYCTENNAETEENFSLVKNVVKKWTQIIGQELYQLSKKITRKERLIQSFKSLEDKIYVGDGATIVEETAGALQTLMDTKVKAVRNIADYAEFLSYYRSDDPLFPNSTYDYYVADNLTSTEVEEEAIKNVDKTIREAECEWWCHQKNLEPLRHNDFITSKRNIEELFSSNDYDESKLCDCESLPDRMDKPPDFFRKLPLKYNRHFNSMVNLNLSVVKVTANIYERDQAVLEGARWSEALDLVFKQNYANDSTLTWQYFASPEGFMRHYPAIKWSEEQYNRTYDPRTRSWYTEAMASPKDVVILLDRSGSIVGMKRGISASIVNAILDTLNDNDFVNVYTFSNSCEPLVPCFANTLVQANEENLRLLRESLSVYFLEFKADISIGLFTAFQLLEEFRNKRGSHCNQIIMLITEGIDYDFHKELFDHFNFEKNKPVRIFTYLLGEEEYDAKAMEWIACANLGYYANVTLLQEVKEKVLSYIPVMSRPINYSFNKKNYFNPIWSYLYVDLVDRRLSNWLWKKYESIRQRKVFLDHVKRKLKREGKMFTSPNHLLFTQEHEYIEYDVDYSYQYLTTVSFPVFARRSNEFNLIGVAGVDVPITLFKSLIPHHKLGVNGYAFILTNNGYVLMHPDHRTRFMTILKPTFNRVDFLEVEILNDQSKPRLFNESILKLRETIVTLSATGSDVQHVKFAIDNMKRIVLAKRTYHFKKLGPFRFVIALPDKYGLVLVNNTQVTADDTLSLIGTSDWKVHPEWIYCNSTRGGDSPEKKVTHCLRYRNKFKDNHLLSSLIFDANATKWFGDTIHKENELVSKYYITKIFMATQSGLTRWKTHSSVYDNQFERHHNKAIDEEWYRRAVEENFQNENVFLYEVPFEHSANEDDTLITATSTVFVGNGKRKTPVAVTGYQFSYRALHELYDKVAVEGAGRKLTCRHADRSDGPTDGLECFILDNNAYVVLCDEPEYTGRYFGDIRPDIMYKLVQDHVFKETRMYNYQAICQKLPPKPKKKKEKKKKSKAKSAAPIRGFTFKNYAEQLMQMTNWALSTIMFFAKSALGGEEYQSLKNDTIAFEKLEIKKTLPTPCDKEMWLFTLHPDFSGNSSRGSATVSKFECHWYYVIEKIPASNLLFLAINRKCVEETSHSYEKSPIPKEINYNEQLPCYIETKFDYSRVSYMTCLNRDNREDNLTEKDKRFCGITWK